MSVVQALAAVMADVQSVAKRERNEQQGFSFRGIDAVVNAVGPALRTHGVVVVPLVEHIDASTVEVGQRRTLMGHVRVTVRYRWYGPDGDHIDSVVIGEAMDSGDKAGAKAMSVAFRTAMLQALALPTDEPDSDTQIYERSPAQTEADDARDALRRWIEANGLDPKEAPARWAADGHEDTLRETGDAEAIRAMHGAWETEIETRKEAGE